MRVVVIVFNIILCVFLNTIIQATEQLDEIDNLQALPESPMKIDSLLNLSKSLWYTDSKKSIEIAREAYRKSIDLKIEEKQAVALNIIGSGFYFLEKIDSSIYYFERSLSLSQKIKYKDGVSRVTNNLGLVYDHLGEYDKAIEYYFKSLEIEKENNNPQGLAPTYLNIGGVYYSLKEYNKALEFMTNSLHVYKQIEDDSGILGCYTNIALVYLEIEVYQSALNYSEKALKLSRKIKNPEAEISNLNNIGLINFKLNNYNVALEYYNKALVLEKEFNDLWSQANTLKNMGRIYLESDDYKNANSFFETSLLIAGEINANGVLSELFYNFYILNEKQGLFEKALYYHKSFTKLKDSLDNLKSREQIAKIESSYNLDNTNLELQTIRSDNINKGSQIKIQRYIIYSIAGFSMFILLLAFFIYYRFWKNKNARKESEQKKELISNQKKLLEETISELKESKEKYKALSESVQEGMIIIQNQNLIYSNSFFSDMLGYSSAEEILNLKPEDLISEEDLDRILKNYKNRIEGKYVPDKYKFKLKNKSGKSFEVSLNIKLISLNNQPAIIGTIKDISKAQEYEKQLIQAKDKAEKATQSKSIFLAGMSHEIRNHMASIIGIADVLGESKLKKDQVEYVDVIKKSGNTLLNLLNNILDLSKIEAGQVSLENEEFDLRILIDEIISLYEINAQNNNLFIKKEVPASLPHRLSGDSIRLSQVIINLLNNGLKFTDKGGVTIKVEEISRDASTIQLKFEIEDTGIGISKDSISKLFKPFSQTHSAVERKKGGTGLGLVICKNIIQLMNGEIGVNSIPGEGTSFWFEIKLDLISNNSPVSVNENSSISKKENNRILLVEDNLLNQHLTTSILEKEGIFTDIASNGSEGLDLFKRKFYKIILMDVQMPVMDGIEATKLIRKYESKNYDSQAIIIAITAHAKETDKANLFAAGMNHYLMKPFKPEALLKIIKNSIEAPKN